MNEASEFLYFVVFFSNESTLMAFAGWGNLFLCSGYFKQLFFGSFWSWRWKEVGLHRESILSSLTFTFC